MICNKCNREMEDSTIFCPYCNTYVNREAVYKKGGYKQGNKFSTNQPVVSASWSQIEDDEQSRVRRGLEVFVYILSLGLIVPTFFINLFGIPSRFSVIVFVMGIVILQIFWFFNLKNKNKNDNTIPKYKNLFQVGLSADMLVKSIIAGEFEKKEKEGVKLISKKVLWIRIGVSVAFVVLLSLLLNLRFYSWIFWPLTSVLVLICEIGVLSQNTRRKVFKEAKAHPDKNITDIINETTYDDLNHPVAKKLAVLCLTLIVVIVTSFVVTHQKSHFILEPIDGGYTIKAFQMGLFDDANVDVPDKIDGKNIVSISNNAFSNNWKIEKVVLAETIVEIGDSAFANCTSLEDITFGNKVFAIGSGAFKNCYSLSNIKLSPTLVKLDGEAFKNCKAINEINIPEGVTEIRGNTFDGCSKLERVTLHDGIIDIHAYAFSRCKKLAAIELPPQIKEIHESTFEECDSLEEIYLPSGVTRIAAHAFDGCNSLYDVFFPDTIKEIGSSAFRECESLMEVYLPEGVSVNERAFKDSPTKLYKKIFTDEERDKIIEGINEIEIDRIYLLYDKNRGKDTIFSPNNDKSIVVSHTDKFKENIADHMDLIEFTKPTDFLVYLKKAKEEGITTVIMEFYSEIATSIKGESYYVSGTFSVDELITAYENDPTEF